MEQSEEQYQNIQRQLNEAETAANELKLQEIHMANKLESLGRGLKYIPTRITRSARQGICTPSRSALNPVNSRVCSLRQLK